MKISQLIELLTKAKEAVGDRSVAVETQYTVWREIIGAEIDPDRPDAIFLEISSSQAVYLYRPPPERSRRPWEAKK